MITEDVEERCYGGGGSPSKVQLPEPTPTHRHPFSGNFENLNKKGRGRLRSLGGEIPRPGDLSRKRDP